MNVTEKQTHTKGPWQTCHRHEIEIGDFIAVRPVSDGPAVAYVADEQDARLIAAAPDLLDAARDAEAVIDQACRCHTLDAGGDCQACLAAAALRTAIARAEGQD